MYCFKCGTENSDSSEYCKNCGEKLIAEMVESSVTTASPAQPATAQPLPQNGVTGTQTRTNVLAIVSLVVSLFSITTGFTTSIIAVICGHIARKQIKEDPSYTGDGMALAGLIIGYLGIGLIVGVIAFYIVIFAVAIMSA